MNLRRSLCHKDSVTLCKSKLRDIENDCRRNSPSSNVYVNISEKKKQVQQLFIPFAIIDEISRRKYVGCTKYNFFS